MKETVLSLDIATDFNLRSHIKNIVRDSNYPTTMFGPSLI